MICPKCGASNDDTSPKCMVCGADLVVSSPGSAGPSAQPPDLMPHNYLILGILTLFCCFPFGIVSIVYASQVSSKYALGDYAGSVDASNKAKIWGIVALVVGIVAVVAAIALTVLLWGKHGSIPPPTYPYR